MKTFREHLSEEIKIGALASGGIGIERDAVRDEINGILSGISSQPCITPYGSLNRIRKALAYFSIFLPKRVYMEGRHGIEVWEIHQFGDKMGMTDQGEFIKSVPAKYYFFLHYHLIGSMYFLESKIVDDKELEERLNRAENMVAEGTDAACQQSMAKAVSPKEPMHDEDDDTVSTKKAVEVSMRRKDKKLSADSLDEEKQEHIYTHEKGPQYGTVIEHGGKFFTRRKVGMYWRTKSHNSKDAAIAHLENDKKKKLKEDALEEAMTRKQKDMAVRRFMSHDPEAGESILAMGKKDREEKKSFASAKKEIKRLKEATMTHIKTKGNKNTGELDVSYKGRHIGSVGKGHRDEYYSSRKGDYSETDEYGSKGKKAAISNLRDQEAHSLRVKRKKLAKISKMEEEQLDELKKSTLASYIKKSAKSQSDLSFDHGEDEHRQYGDRGEDPDRDKEVDNRERKISNREKGINRAADRLAKEETMEEGRMPPPVIAHKQKLASMSDKEFAEKHGHKSEKALRDMAARHGYGFDKATKTGSDHYVKRVSSAKQIDELYGKGSLEKIRSHHQGEANKLSQGGRKQEKKMGALGRLHRDSEARDSAIKYHHDKAKKARGLMSKLAMKEDTLDEKAPPGAKYERMVKHIKAGYAKDGLTAKEKGIAFATAWKAKKKEKREKEQTGKKKTILVTKKGEEHAKQGGGVFRVRKDQYDPKKHNLASE